MDMSLKEEFTFSHCPPEIPLSTDSSCLQDKTVFPFTEEKKREFMTYVRNYPSATVPVPYNFFEQLLEVPAKSFIPIKYHKGILDICDAYFSQSLDDKIEGSKILNTKQRDKVSMYLVVAYSNPQLRTTFDFIGSTTNKIHLQPKDEYIVWCVLKLNEFAKTVLKDYPANNFRFKFRIETSQSRKITKNETFLKSLEVDGGNSPNIVIYGSSNPAIMTYLIKGISKLFEGYEDLIGNMDMNSKEDILPFNVRINPLLSYAAGDRSQSLDLMINIRNKKKTYSDYDLPPWLIKEQAARCPTDQDGLNATTRAILGIDVCKDNKPIDLITICNESFDEENKFCFIKKNGAILLNPIPFYEEYKKRKNLAKAPNGASGGRRLRRKTRRNLNKQGQRKRYASTRVANRRH